MVDTFREFRCSAIDSVALVESGSRKLLPVIVAVSIDRKTVEGKANDVRRLRSLIHLCRHTIRKPVVMVGTHIRSGVARTFIYKRCGDATCISDGEVVRHGDSFSVAFEWVVQNCSRNHDTD